MDPTASYGDSFTSAYADDVRTSQEAHLWTTTACYGDSFTSVYVDDVRTSQEAHLWTTTACYGDNLICPTLYQVLTCCALQFQDDWWGGGPAHEHSAAGLVAPGTAGCTRGTAGTLVVDAALPAPLQPSVSPPPCSHHLRLQVLRPGADSRQAGRHHVS
jgi:hypothetical protein